MQKLVAGKRGFLFSVPFTFPVLKDVSTASDSSGFYEACLRRSEEVRSLVIHHINARN